MTSFETSLSCVRTLPNFVTHVINFFRKSESGSPSSYMAGQPLRLHSNWGHCPTPLFDELQRLTTFWNDVIDRVVLCVGRVTHHSVEKQASLILGGNLYSVQFIYFIPPTPPLPSHCQGIHPPRRLSDTKTFRYTSFVVWNWCNSFSLLWGVRPLPHHPFYPLLCITRSFTLIPDDASSSSSFRF